MALKVRTGVRPQSKVAHWRWLLGSGPKVKSLATVLWRQTRGLRQTEGCRGKFVEKIIGSRRNPF
jgi:hypothetical protein